MCCSATVANAATNNASYWRAVANAPAMGKLLQIEVAPLCEREREGEGKKTSEIKLA